MGRHLDHGHVSQGVSTKNLAGKAASIGQGHRDGAGPFHHMGIGEQHTIGAGDESRPLALLLLHRGPATKHAHGVHHLAARVDAHHRWAHLGHRISHKAAARLQRRCRRCIADHRSLTIPLLPHPALAAHQNGQASNGSQGARRGKNGSEQGSERGQRYDTSDQYRLSQLATAVPPIFDLPGGSIGSSRGGLPSSQQQSLGSGPL